MNKHSSNVTKARHFLLGAGLALVVTFSASSVFAQQFVQNPQSQLMKCLNLGGKTVTVAECQAADTGAGIRWCAPGETPQTGPTGGATCKTTPLDSEQQPAQSTQQGQQLPFCMGGQEPSSGTCAFKQPPSQPATAPTQQITAPAQSDNGISDLKKMLEEMKAEQEKQKQEQEKEDLMKMLKEATQQNKQQPSFEDQQLEEEAPVLQQQNNKVNKPKLSSAKNPAVALAKKGLQNVNKLLNTLSKKFKKERNTNKKLAVVRSVAKDFMKLCTKYAPSIQDEDFGDDESFTCDEFVADISESIASALKSKDVDLAFEATYDALDINFRELFDSLTQQ